MAEVRIPNAKTNPRISGGTLRWCAGDTFSFYLDFDLKDQDSESIDISAGSTVAVKFYNLRRVLVKEFPFTAITNNSVTLTFDAAATALFPAGAYKYDIIYTDGQGNTTFLAKQNPCVVE